MDRLSLVFFLVVAFAGFLECEGACAGSSAGPLPEFLPFCRWYSPSSCCTDWASIESARVEVEAIDSHYGSGNNSCGSVSTKCASAIALVACGIRCSPTTGSFVSEDLRSATLCPAMSRRLYDSCKDFVDGSPCVRLGDSFPTAEKFAESLGLKVAADGSTDCFSFAPSITPMALVVTALLVVVVVVLVE